MNRRTFMMALTSVPISAAMGLVILERSAMAAVPADFLAFWADFRGAVEKGDKARITALTLFPFRICGALDSDPVRKVSKAAFGKALDQLLDSEIMLGINITKTMREHIIAHVTPDANEVGVHGANIGHFFFAKAKGQWLFTKASTGETN